MQEVVTWLSPSNVSPIRLKNILKMEGEIYKNYKKSWIKSRKIKNEYPESLFENSKNSKLGEFVILNWKSFHNDWISDYITSLE